MDWNIDHALDAAFTPQSIKQAFYDYKLAKWDRFSGFDDPKINIPIGADGVTYQAFEKQLERHARNISRRIEADNYIFYPFREVDKKKDPDLPLTEDNVRTLGIASIRDALVQTILYEDVLYEPVEALFRNLDESGPVSFAYRKGKSAPLAAKYVYRYSRDGYWFVYDADLSKYFDTIPHVKLLKKIAQVIGGNTSRTYRLVRRFVRTDRAPHSTYKYVARRGKRIGYKIFHWRKPNRRRPKRDKGVPQGGVLSGMLANLYLHKFDEWIVKELAERVDLKYVRYADDFIIMVKSPDALSVIDQEVNQKLRTDSFSLEINEHKTKKIDIREDGLDFVGFHFDGQHIRVRRKTVERFKARIVEEIFHAIPQGIKQRKSPKRTLNWLTWRINSKIQGMRGREECPRCRCERIGPPRSWMAFFRVVTDDSQLRELDKWIRKRLYDYVYSEFDIRINRKALKRRPRRKGLRSLVNEKYQVRAARRRPCLCDIRENDDDVWEFASDLFEGRTFKTLSQKRPFAVPFVDDDGLQISVKKRQYRVGKVVFQDLWDRLVSGEAIVRANLEREGIRNTSHIVALIAEFPGVEVKVSPITLIYKEKPPADFLIEP